MKDKQNDGKEAERIAAQGFALLLKDYRCSIARLHDTKSAAYFLPPSQGDFMGGYQGHALLVECKSSDVRRTFSQCNPKDYIKPTQFGFHKMWHVTGNVGVFVFHSIPYNTMELWKSFDVLEAYSGGGWGSPIKTFDAGKHEFAKNFKSYMREVAGV